jgi:hypothetical protein
LECLDVDCSGIVIGRIYPFRCPIGRYGLLRTLWNDESRGVSYEATVELTDAEGREAIYVKQERIRFLRDGISTFEDYGWGNGIAFSVHDVYPGSFAWRKLVGSRLQSVVKLPHAYQTGDHLTFSVERVIKNGFCSPSECWLEAELYHATHRIFLKAILPRTRRVQRARLVCPGTPGSRSLRVRRLPDGRQCISYKERDPTQGKRYTLVWDW